MTQDEWYIFYRLIVFVIFAKKIIGSPFRYWKRRAMGIDRELMIFLSFLSPLWAWIGFVYVVTMASVLLTHFAGYELLINPSNYLSFIRGWVGLLYVFFLGAVVWKVLP